MNFKAFELEAPSWMDLFENSNRKSELLCSSPSTNGARKRGKTFSLPRNIELKSGGFSREFPHHFTSPDDSENKNANFPLYIFRQTLFTL
jgi:hypothetical protein